jgi:dihydrolipoamide dehydrogenase
MTDRFDLIVIGSGPGGYVAAIKAAQLGMKTALAESREIGGTCLNRGCIPTKTLMHSSHLYQEALHLQEAGISFTGLSYDYDRILERKDEVVGKIRQGIKGLLEANGITLLYGTATIRNIESCWQEDKNNNCDNQKNDRNSSTDNRMEDRKTNYDNQIDDRISDCNNQEEERLSCTVEGSFQVSVASAEGVKVYDTTRILIATGSKPVIPGIEGTDLPDVVTSDELLSREGKLYQKLLIVGGGVIGVEFATIYRELGCEVEIIEAMDRILPNMDKEISQSVAMSLKKKGVSIHTKSRVTRFYRETETGLFCKYEENGTIKSTNSEGILLAIGRRASTGELFGDGSNVELDGACIKVNENFETNIPGIYAIGDVIKGKQLAHAASAQGIAAVERMCGREPSICLDVIPSCIYTTPEVAVVGMEESEAVEKGYTVKVGKYPMLGNSKTVLSMGERGFIKVISDALTGRILGAVLLCDRATDMVSEFATAIVNGLTVKELSSVIRPHPTYSEAITEAVEDVEGMAIHLLPKRR